MKRRERARVLRALVATFVNAKAETHAGVDEKKRICALVRMKLAIIIPDVNRAAALATYLAMISSVYDLFLQTLQCT